MDLTLQLPSDYTSTLSQTLTPTDLTNLQAQTSSPRFVYGILMLPPVLKYYTSMPPSTAIHKNMTQATLPGYKLYQFAESSTPVIHPSSDPEARVEGVLVFGLDEQQRNEVFELEAGLMRLVDVRVCVRVRVDSDSDEQGIRMVEAGAFAWYGDREGLILMDMTKWPVDEFLASPFYEYILHSQRRDRLEGSWSAPRRHGSAGSYSRFGSLERIKEEKT